MCDFYLVNDLCSRLDNICCSTTLRIECTDNCFVHAKCKLSACLCSAGILSESSQLHLTVKVCRDKRTIFTSISFAYQSVGSTSGKINQNHRKLCSAFRRIPGESHISAPRARIRNLDGVGICKVLLFRFSTIDNARVFWRNTR